MIAAMFGRHPSDINRLYFSDLCGASLGCALCVPLMAIISPPACVYLAGFALTAAGLRLAYQESRALFSASIVVCLAMAAMVVMPHRLPDPVPDSMKTMSDNRTPVKNVMFSKWNPVFRIDLLEWPLSGDKLRMIIHDGLLGSTLHRFNGDISTLSRFDTDLRSFPFEVGPKEPEILIIGSAGGHEILASLHFDAKHITAVELNPVTVSLLTDHFADYSGHLPEIDRVSLINAEGRSFMKESGKKYDIIYFVAPDSYSAMNAATAGAFVLSESYLYTQEMITDSLAHLKEGGVICMQFGEVAYATKPNRTARYAATAREAFRSIGVDDFEKHVLVATSPSLFSLSTLLLSREGFTQTDIDAFIAAVGRVENSEVRHAWGRTFDDGPVNKVITLGDDELTSWLDDYGYAVHAITDDSPFFWHFARFRDVITGKRVRNTRLSDMEDALGERVLLFVLVFAACFAAIFLLLPFVVIRKTWAELPYRSHAILYFGALGMGFMLYEVYLIQRLTLFLGYPTYSLTVTLMAILVSTGIGSLLSERYLDRRNSALTVIFCSLLVVTGFYLFGITPLINGLIGTPLAVRVATSIIFVFPLGICLGAFMPLGLATVSDLTVHKEQYVAWGWAVNGFFSVLSSVLATILSMSYGFRATLVLAVVIYAVGTLTLRSIPTARKSAA